MIRKAIINLNYLFVVIFFALSLNIFGQWTKQESGTTNSLFGVDFSDANNGIAIGANTTVLYTNNGGQDWNDASGTTETDFYDVELVNDTLGYLVGQNAAFYQTKNGGQTWSKGNDDFDQTETLRDLEIASSGYFLSVNWTDQLYLGLHDSVEVDEFAYLEGTFIALDISTTDNYVYVTGLRNDEDYNLYKAKEDEVGSKSNWTKVHSFSVSGNNYDDFYFVDFPTDEVGYMAGSRAHGALGSNTACVEKTTDGGENFEIVYQPVGTNKVTDLFFLNENVGWVILDNQAIIRTTDGGESWEPATEGITAPIYNFVFVDENVGYAVGVQGTIFKTTNGGGTTTAVEQKSSIPTDFSLDQNYPNPFNPSTSISYSIPKQSNVSLKVYDVIGKEVVELVNSEKPAGTYEINFNAENLSSGVYFYTLKTDNFLKTKKMLLLK